MNKQELINQVAEKTSMTKAEVGQVIGAMIDVVQDAVRSNDKVVLTGFGSFELVKTSERQGRNPATGAAITVPAGRRPKFSPGKAFKDFVR